MVESSFSSRRALASRVEAAVVQHEDPALGARRERRHAAAVVCAAPVFIPALQDEQLAAGGKSVRQSARDVARIECWVLAGVAIDSAIPRRRRKRSRRFFAFVILTRDPPILRFNAEKRREYGRKIRADLPATCLRSCVYWSIVQTFNFRLLPPKYTVIATSAAYLVWTVYLSLVANIRRS